MSPSRALLLYTTVCCACGPNAQEPPARAPRAGSTGVAAATDPVCPAFGSPSDSSVVARLENPTVELRLPNDFRTQATALQPADFRSWADSNGSMVVLHRTSTHSAQSFGLIGYSMQREFTCSTTVGRNGARLIHYSAAPVAPLQDIVYIAWLTYDAEREQQELSVAIVARSRGRLGELIPVFRSLRVEPHP